MFLSFHDHLKQSFPLLHKLHPPEIINKFSLLYKIPGTPDANTTQPPSKPILLCSHLDVVPAPNDHNAWVHDPFSGTIVDNVIWGRGGTYVKGWRERNEKKVERFCVFFLNFHLTLLYHDMVYAF